MDIPERLLNLHGRIDSICEGVKAWLDNEDGICQNSVERTVTEGLFQRHDVEHMLAQAATTITKNALETWADRVLEPGVNRVLEDEKKRESHFKQQKILCLHAGNLPMVGLQDVIATLLSGGVYYGKLSSRDPWLLDGLLRVLRKRLPEQFGGWAARLEYIDPLMAQIVLFAGSLASVDTIKHRIQELNLAAPDARFLPRTARFSVAWLGAEGAATDNGHSSLICNQLVEAMLRYEGKGCRSVAVIIASRPLSEYAGKLMDEAANFVGSNPPSMNDDPAVRYWKSYLKAAGKGVLDLGGQIITEDTEMMGKQGLICWVKGDREDVRRIAGRFGHQLQSIYVDADPAEAGPGGLHHPAKFGLPDTEGIRLESLCNAQAPPIHWQPDGIDVLDWLMGDS